MTLLFFLLWILLAGEVTAAVCLTGAAAAILLTVFCRQMLGYGGTTFLPPRRFWRLFCYLGRLLAEMLKAGFIVMKLVYTKGRNMKPVLVRFDTEVQENVWRSMLADSITLTAGTITVSTADGHLRVHALDRSLAEGIEKSIFEEKLRKIEK
jgi:multicomponent Na+:H+ antiporter subunit E